jgi:hypothetical protein
VIALATSDGATINNNSGGSIRGEANSTTDLIVEAHGGAVTINNAGTMTGRIDLSDAGSSQLGNVFNNTSDDSWHFTGTSDLGGGLADAYNNTGTIYTTDPNDPANNDVTELTGVEIFNNGDSVKTGTIDLQDGFTGDLTTLSPTTGGALAFNGTTGHSVLKVDSFLGKPSDSSSDELIIKGDVTGATGIDVNNTNPGFGSYNPTGIAVVNATGSVSPGNFFLTGGPIDTGLFNYDLYLNGANQWVLASSPSQTFFQLPSLTSAAQSIWHNAAGIWLDRTADLRAAAGYGCTPDRKDGWKTVCTTRPKSGAWAKVLGTTERRSQDHSFSLFNTAQKYTVDYRLNTVGVVGGYDFARSAQNGRGTWMAGVMGGYLASDLDFRGSVTNADFESGVVGGYLTYLEGGWFLDGKVVANLGSVDYNGSHSVKNSANVTSIGGVLDTGYRMNYGAAFFEPGATLAYVNTDIDDLAIYGSSVGFSNGESLRGRLGLRLGTTIVKEQAKYEPFIGVSAWYEFLGDNSANVTSGSYVLKAADDVSGAIGEVTGGVDVYSLAGDNFSAFVKGNVAFGEDDFVGYAGTVGLRLGW